MPRWKTARTASEMSETKRAKSEDLFGSDYDNAPTLCELARALLERKVKGIRDIMYELEKKLTHSLCSTTRETLEGDPDCVVVSDRVKGMIDLTSLIAYMKPVVEAMKTVASDKVRELEEKVRKLLWKIFEEFTDDQEECTNLRGESEEYQMICLIIDGYLWELLSEGTQGRNFMDYALEYQHKKEVKKIGKAVGAREERVKEVVEGVDRMYDLLTYGRPDVDSDLLSGAIFADEMVRNTEFLAAEKEKEYVKKIVVLALGGV